MAGNQLIIDIRANLAELSADLGEGQKKFVDAAEVMERSVGNVGASSSRTGLALSGLFDDASVSAGQMNAALRSLPAQFTDIVVSLQSGQAPLTVLMQQGGQIKDMFGGVGPAIRGVSTYLIGLINPLTLSAAAVAALATGFYMGQKEMQGYVTALTLTNNASGITIDRMLAMSQAMDDAGGTQAAAAEALQAMASTGAVAADSLQNYASAAMGWASVTSASVDDVAGNFAKLADDPVQAVQGLDKEMRFLTATTLDHINSLVDEGKKVDAARLAQDAYADALRDRTAEMQGNLGIIERSWLAIKGAIKETGDAMLEVGRKQTIAQQIAAKQKELAELSNPLAPANLYNTGGVANMPSSGSGVTNAAAEQRKKQLLAEIAGLQSDAIRAQTDATRSAEREAIRVAGVAAVRELNGQLDAAAPKAEKMAKALDELHRNVAAAAKAGKAYSAEEVASMEQAIREKYKTRAVRQRSGLGAGVSEVAAIEAEIQARQHEIDILYSADAATQQLTAGQKKLLDIEQKLRLARTDVQRSPLLLQKEAAQRLVAVETELRQQTVMRESALQLNQSIDNWRKQQVLDGLAIMRGYETQLEQLEREHQARLQAIRENASLTPEQQGIATQRENANFTASRSSQMFGVQSDLGMASEQEKIVQAHQEMQRRIAQVTAEGTAERVQLELAANRKLQADTEALERQKVSTVLGMSQQVFDGMAALAETAAGKQSAAYKVMFLASKAASIAMAIVNTEEAATKALTMGPIFGVPAATMIRGLGYASVGIMAAQAVQGMAHDGIDNIPREGTWLLDKGERVVDSRTNEDLKNYLSRQTGGAENVGVSVVINNNVSGVEVQASSSATPDGGVQVTLEVVRKIADTVYETNLARDLRSGGRLNG